VEGAGVGVLRVGGEGARAGWFCTSCEEE
jgi:hypothetical protein